MEAIAVKYAKMGFRTDVLTDVTGETVVYRAALGHFAGQREAGIARARRDELLATIAGWPAMVQEGIQRFLTVQRTADREGVKIREYDVIYNLLDDVKGLLEGLLVPEEQEKILGHLEVKGVFFTRKNEQIIGGRVADGVIKRLPFRLMRGEQNILWPTDITWFSKSSGTTNQRSKFIPVSQEALEECHFKGGKDLISIYVNNFPDTRLFDGKGLAVGGLFVAIGHSPNTGFLNGQVELKPNGYIRTKDEYENYRLTLEWRWPEGGTPGNNGVLIHTTTPKELGVWPKSLEVQLAHENAGDFWVIGTTVGYLIGSITCSTRTRAANNSANRSAGTSPCSKASSRTVLPAA